MEAGGGTFQKQEFESEKKADIGTPRPKPKRVRTKSGTEYTVSGIWFIRKEFQ